SNLVIRAIRDYFNTDIEEILIDNQDIYDQASQFMNHVMPDYADRIQLYEESTALFSKFNIENQIESAFLREVQLPSGGVIVIDHTEALVSIDVNSSRSTKGRDIENTAFNTNLEAAKEVAKQLRLRDIGGLIVVDFIDMENPKHQREVEECLRDALKHDKARIQTGRISRFGLMELSRQRLRPSIGETSNGECPKCNGTGRIRDFQSSALHIIRMIQEQSNKKQGQKISVQVPVDVATFLLNEKREIIIQTESEGNNKVFIIANKYFDVPQFKITSSDLGNKKELSYQEVDVPDVENLDDSEQETKDKQMPAVKGVIPEKRSRKSKNKSLFGFIKGLIA
ncbi:MAG: ribonuclease E/G, partial [Gammaproteobacteria bacterium]|nr:ribonuclease E/G [Gammaproteobacteria bacterium]